MRDDLLALDPDKLAILANRGFVKRATKYLAEDRGPSLSVLADGTVIAVAGDVTTRLIPNTPLRETPCTCGALEVCRHRLMAVLAYRAKYGREGPAEVVRWSPSVFTDDAVEARLGRWAWGRASRRRKAGFVAEVIRPGTRDVPSAELPTCTVRFLVPESLSYAHCDCEAGAKCEHIALAVWAFREADARFDPSIERATVEVGEGAQVGLGSLEAAISLGRELLLDGAVGSGAALAGRFARAKKPLTEAKLLWPMTICEDLEETLSSYAGRSAAYHPERVGDLLTELHGRARAAGREGEVPTRAILGMDGPMETRLEHLRLVSLGCRLRREPIEDDARVRVRADVFLADPDTQTVLVLRRAWDVPEDESGPTIARRHVQPGVPLGTLARGQMVTKAARRRANRLLVLGRGRVGRTSVTPQRGEWSLFRAPLFVREYEALARTLRSRPPACVRPRRLAERVHVLAVHAVAAVAYHSGEQTLRADLYDEVGTRVRLELAHSSAAPRAIDALTAALRSGIRFVSGEARREGEQLVVSPLSVVTDRVIALDLADPDLADPDLADPDLVEPDLADSTTDELLQRDELSPPVDVLHEALVETREHLDVGAHAGLRHVSVEWRDELAKRSRRLSQVGLRSCAARVEGFVERLAGRHGGRVEAEEALAEAWLDASLRIRLALEAV